jgi:hypothetical protein
MGKDGNASRTQCRPQRDRAALGPRAVSGTRSVSLSSWRGRTRASAASNGTARRGIAPVRPQASHLAARRGTSPSWSELALSARRWHRCCDGFGMTAFHPIEPFLTGMANGRCGAGRATRGATAEWPRRVVSRPPILVTRYRDYDSVRSRYGCVIGTLELCSMQSSFTLPQGRESRSTPGRRTGHARP